jgi:hypothetical protein
VRNQSWRSPIVKAFNRDLSNIVALLIRYRQASGDDKPAAMFHHPANDGFVIYGGHALAIPAARPSIV